ncbi:hypothetical protein ACH427_27510 [Streptomyces sp. NPDC020379]|uniref:hypothetical protein n=1 Tax=Streptomyces sp. NPDC020379 TaxID=3365071 RepID=UPI003794C957
MADRQLPTPYAVLDAALTLQDQMITATGGRIGILHAVKADADPPLPAAWSVAAAAWT